MNMPFAMPMRAAAAGRRFGILLGGDPGPGPAADADAGLGPRIEYVDLRYANGFAVRIAELKGESTATTHGGSGVKRRTKGT